MTEPRSRMTYAPGSQATFSRQLQLHCIADTLLLIPLLWHISARVCLDRSRSDRSSLLQHLDADASSQCRPSTGNTQPSRIADWIVLLMIRWRSSWHLSEIAAWRWASGHPHQSGSASHAVIGETLSLGAASANLHGLTPLVRLLVW